MSNIEDFFQRDLIIEIANVDVDADGHLDKDQVSEQIGYLFTDENNQPIKGLKAYHKAGSSFVELSLPKGKVVTTIQDLQPVLAFPDEEELVSFIQSQEVTYWKYEEDESVADGLLRKIAVGTHLPVFVNNVKMQKQRLSSLELTHQDERFNVRGQIEKGQGKALKDVFYSADELKFTWITAGGHGKSGDGEA